MNLPASLEEGKSYEMPDFVLEHRMCSAGDSSDLNEWKPAAGEPALILWPSSQGE